MRKSSGMFRLAVQDDDLEVAEGTTEKAGSRVGCRSGTKPDFAVALMQLGTIGPAQQRR